MGEIYRLTIPEVNYVSSDQSEGSVVDITAIVTQEPVCTEHTAVLERIAAEMREVDAVIGYESGPADLELFARLMRKMRLAQVLNPQSINHSDRA